MRFDALDAWWIGRSRPFYVVAWIWIFLILRAKYESPANEKIALLCALKVGNRGGRCTREDLNARWDASLRAANSRSFEAYAFEPDGWMCERVFVRLRAQGDFATGWGFSALVVERERERSLFRGDGVLFSLRLSRRKPLDVTRRRRRKVIRGRALDDFSLLALGNAYLPKRLFPLLPKNNRETSN